MNKRKKTKFGWLTYRKMWGFKLYLTELQHLSFLPSVNHVSARGVLFFGYDVIHYDRPSSQFQNTLLSLPSVFKVKTADCSKTIKNFYKTALRYIPEFSILHSHRCENLKYYQLKVSSV